MVDDAALDSWIERLRERVDRGALDGLAPFDLGYGTGDLPGQATVRIMLADLDHLAMLEALGRQSRNGLVVSARRASLLDDFRRLRELIG